MFNFLTQGLNAQKKSHRFRQRTLLEPIKDHPNHILVAGERYLNFSSNDYLGLNNHVKIKQAMQEGVDKFGICSTGSSLITGYSFAHQALEETICSWINKPKCLLFNSGFSANNGTLQALGQQNCYLYLDKLSHASIIDGAYSSEAVVKRFLHNDINQLNSFIDKAKQKSEKSDHLIVSEGVFSMDGDKANIAKLSELAKQKQAMLYIDDAHSIGVLGERGQGSSAESNDIDIVMATFGKAIATSGAFIACDENVFEYLVNFSRHYIYSTAISPAMAWATKASIELIQQESWRRDKIIELSNLFVNQLSDKVDVLSTDSSIHAVVIGSEEKTLKISDELKKQGVWLSAIRPPTVANNKSRLRVTICSHHNDKDINHLANCLNRSIETIK